MSEHEWKPGDVAMVRFAWQVNKAPMVCIRAAEGGRLGWLHEPRLHEPRSIGRFTPDDHPAGPVSVTPVAVIPFEDPAQVERLLNRLQEISFSAHAWGAFTCLQAALREFADPPPPKPDEPQGLGAVVEDAEGCRFTRTNVGGWEWHEAGGGPTSWGAIAAVRVLSEGVQ